jgi:hypothetical protein
MQTNHKKNGTQIAGRRFLFDDRRPQNVCENLDQVDASWQISRNFHADSLLANLWLVPDFHDRLLRG